MKKAIYITSILILAFIIGGIVYLNQPNYEIHKPCKLQNLTDTCSEDEIIKIDTLDYNNQSLKANQLNKTWLNNNCNELKEEIWACGQFLIK